MISSRGRFSQVLKTVARNGALVRLLLAFSAMTVAEYGQWVALIVYAYSRGGASEAGLVVMVQLVPSILLAPLLSAHLARFGAARLLAGAYLLATVSLACSGVAILIGAPVGVVFLAAVTFSVSLGVGRPLHNVLMPLVVRHPAELASANIATSWAEGSGALLGPAAAGLMISTDGPGLACTLLAAVCLATPLLAGISSLSAGAGQAEDSEGGLADLLAAARVISMRPGTRAIVAFLAAAAAIEGAIDLLAVVLAVEVLGVGQGAAGYLSAAFGAGGLLGALGAVTLVGRRLAVPLAAAALLGGLALAALALVSTLLTALALLALVGASRAVQNVAAQTLLQRSTPLDVLVCVFALVESVRDLGLGFGALVVPLLIGVGGATAAFVGMASLAPIVVLLVGRRIRRIDRDASIPIVEMGILRNTPIFGAMSAAPLETLAREARYASVAGGTPILVEGDEGDSYYSITSGAVLVTKGGREIRSMSSGEGFGEIALLHSVKRTATVTAITDTTVLRVPRDTFLTALGAHTAVSAAAGRVATGFLRDAE